MTREQFIDRVEESQKAFRRFLAALCCGDMQLADDIAQDSYMKAWLSCDGLNDKARFNAWLYRIGYNTFISHRRSARPMLPAEAATDAAAADSADSAFRYQALYAALDRLPPRERTSVLLFYMEGYSVKEIAATVEASDGAVRQYLSRGREHLRGLLTSNQR